MHEEVDTRVLTLLDMCMLCVFIVAAHANLPPGGSRSWSTNHLMQTVGGNLLRTLGRDDPSLGMASVEAPAIPRLLDCGGGCGAHGNCDPRNGTCSCQMGWAGAHCEKELFPSCRLSPAPPDVVQGGGPSLVAMCANMRKLSPVACECVAECLRQGHEVCGPNSYGCQFPWKDHGQGARTRRGFHTELPCFAMPPGTAVHSSLPPPQGARLVSFSSYTARGYVASEGAAAVPGAEVAAFGAGHQGRDSRPSDAVWLPEASCGVQGCSGRGRCLQSSGGKGRGKRRGARGMQRRSCVCADGAYGPACEHACDNDCFNSCSGHGTCVHGWCKCDPGWFGVDCSDTLGLRYSRAELPRDVSQFGDGPVHAQIDQLPPELQAHARRLKRAVYVYDLPANVNRRSEVWMWKQWGPNAGHGCDPVHNRRIYAAQSHFDSHLLHDDHTRTLDPTEAVLFYVPVFLNQRVTWGADLRAPHTPMVAALEHIRHAHPWWNASGGRNHVWFVFGERQTCLIPTEISQASIVIGHWGDLDCVSDKKDVIVPTITPIQHDLPRFHQRLQRAMRAADAQSFERNGPLLLFAGGIMSFGASQVRGRRWHTNCDGWW